MSIRCQGRRSSRIGEWVYGGKREVFKDEGDLFGIFVQHLPEQRLEPRTVRSLIVTEHGYGNGCALGAFIRKPRSAKGMHYLKLDNPYRIA